MPAINHSMMKLMWFLEGPMNKAELSQAFTTLIDASSSMVAFTGAGISTESGIPDFRGPQGVWKTQTPIDFNDFVSSESWRRKAWERKFRGEDKMAKATPNSGHYALERWISEGKMTHIITQNVDGVIRPLGYRMQRSSSFTVMLSTQNAWRAISDLN